MGLGGDLGGGADALRGSKGSWEEGPGPRDHERASPPLPPRWVPDRGMLGHLRPCLFPPQAPTPRRPPGTTSLCAATAGRGLSLTLQAHLGPHSTGRCRCAVLSPSIPLWAPLLSDTHPPGPVAGSAEVLAAHCPPHEDGHGLVPAMALRLAASTPRLDPKEGSWSLRQWQGAPPGCYVAGECLEAGVKLERVLLHLRLCLRQVVTSLSP